MPRSNLQSTLIYLFVLYPVYVLHIYTVLYWYLVYICVLHRYLVYTHIYKCVLGYHGTYDLWLLSMYWASDITQRESSIQKCLGTGIAVW